MRTSSAMLAAPIALVLLALPCAAALRLGGTAGTHLRRSVVGLPAVRTMPTACTRRRSRVLLLQPVAENEEDKLSAAAIDIEELSAPSPDESYEPPSIFDDAEPEPEPEAPAAPTTPPPAESKAAPPPPPPALPPPAPPPPASPAPPALNPVVVAVTGFFASAAASVGEAVNSATARATDTVKAKAAAAVQEVKAIPARAVDAAAAKAQATLDEIRVSGAGCGGRGSRRRCLRGCVAPPLPMVEGRPCDGSVPVPLLTHPSLLRAPLCVQAVPGRVRATAAEKAREAVDKVRAAPIEAAEGAKNRIEAFQSGQRSKIVALREQKAAKKAKRQ